MDQLIEGLQITQWNQMNASFKMAVGKKKLECVGHGVLIEKYCPIQNENKYITQLC